MKIAFFGDGEWAHSSLVELINKKQHKIQIVVVRADYKDPELIRIAKSNGIEYTWTENVNSIEFINQINKLNCDLAVSMSFNQIIKKELIEIFEKGFINCHAGKLPNYRGRNIINWAIINGESEIGITCHYIDEGIDTGPIIFQETIEISIIDNYNSVLKKIYKACPKVLLKGIDLIDKNEVSIEKQPEEGTYFTRRKVGDEFIDWDQCSMDIYNFVRGISSPGPNARTWVYYKQDFIMVKILRVSLIKNSIKYKGENGAIIGFSQLKKPIVKTRDTSLIIEEYEILSDKKNKLNIGDRLGVNLNLFLMKFTTFPLWT